MKLGFSFEKDEEKKCKIEILGLSFERD